MTEQKQDLVASFKKEQKNTKFLLISAAAFLISSFLPWISFYGVGVNGWTGIVTLGNLAAIATLALWILPKFKIDLGELTKKTELVYKVLSATMAGSVVIFILQANFSFSVFGIGAYMAIAASAAAVFFAFVGMKK